MRGTPWRGTSRRGGIGRGLPAAAAAMEAGVGSKSADDDDGKVDVDKGDDEIECAGVLETPATLLPARAASQGEGGLGLTRGSILCEKERARGEALFFPNRALQGKKKNTRSLARSRFS